MKKHGKGPDRGGRMVIAGKILAIALVLGLTGPAVGDIMAPTHAEAQVEGLWKVKRFLIWDYCSQDWCWRGYCCGWTDV